MTFWPWAEAPPGDFAVIGDPVAHSLSPCMHAAAYAALGLPYRYHAIHVPVGEVAPALAHLASVGYRGVNVTVPHKREALTAVKHAEPLAERVQAVNTIRLEDLAGRNTDAPGFMETLRDRGLGPCPALVLGAGGSAWAIVAALCADGYAVRVWNRTRSRAEEMVASLAVDAPVEDEPILGDARLIVNTTSAGIAGEEVPLDWTAVDADALAYDLMYKAEPTPFLRAAARVGLNTVDGRDLLVAQGALAFEWWLGIEAPRRAMREVLG